MMLQNISI